MCRKCIKRDLTYNEDYHKYFQIRHGEDLLQSINIFERATSVLFIPDRLYEYKINETSISNSLSYKDYHVDFSVKEYTLKFLLSHNYFTEEDINDYRIYCRSLVMKEVRTIARLDTSRGNKIALFEEIKNNTFYIDFIINEVRLCELNQRNDRIIAFLFDHSMYNILLAVLNAL